MIIYLYDPEFNEVSHNDTRDPHLLYRVSVARGTPLSNAVANIVAYLTAHAAAPPPRRTISKLVIVSHGAPGAVMIGEGLQVDNVSVLARLAPFFAPGNEGVLFEGCSIVANSSVFQNYQLMTWDQVVEGTASDGHRYDTLHIQRMTEIFNPFGGSFQLERQPGMALLRAIAAALHTSVRAAVGRQLSDPGATLHIAGNPRIDNSDFEGQYVSVSADGAATIMQGTPYSDFIRAHLPGVEARHPSQSAPPPVITGLDDL